MSDYTPYTIDTSFVEDTREIFFANLNGRNVNFGPTGLNFNQAQIDGISFALRVSHLYTKEKVKDYVDHEMKNLVDHFNNTIESSFNKTTTVMQQDMRKELEEQKKLVANYKKQVDDLPADASSGHGGRMPKIPEPPTFKGNDDKKLLEDWLNQISLYCAHQGITTDKQKIVIALTRLTHPASLYVRSYMDKMMAGEDVGSWKDFTEHLRSMYGQRDEKQGAKEELNKLWENKSLASNDFIKFAEQYRTLATVLDYEDKIHIDKIENVISKELRTPMVFLKVSNMLPKKWTDYLDMLIVYYKELHPEKAKATIFGKDNGGTSSKSQEANSAQASKGKGKDSSKRCSICAADPKHKQRASSHNTADCWSKPENEGKRPAPRSTPAASGSNNGGNSRPQGNSQASGSGTRSSRFQALKARITEMSEALEELGRDEASTGSTSAGTVNVNTARLEHVEDLPLPSSSRTAPTSDEPSGGSLSLTGTWRRTRSDFPEGL